MYKTKEDVISIIRKHSPTAKLLYITTSGIVYTTEHENITIMFLIPLNDVTTNRIFTPTMSSKDLEEWLFRFANN